MGGVLALVLVSSLHVAIGESCDHWLLLNSYVKAAVTHGRLHHPTENKQRELSWDGNGITERAQDSFCGSGNILSLDVHAGYRDCLINMYLFY